jgi:hypothetical protein
VHILQVQRPFEIAGDDFILYQREAATDIFEIHVGDDAAGCQHLRMRQRAPDIEQRQLAVEIHRRGITLHQFSHGLIETSRPCLFVLYASHLSSRIAA